MANKTTKICSTCGLEKDLQDFHKSANSKDGYRSQCRVCANKKRRERVAKNKDGDVANYSKIGIQLPDELVGPARLEAYHKLYRLINKDEIKLAKKFEADQAKIEGIVYYGGKCSCCGETRIEFLTLEHLNGRDKTKRRRTGKQAWLEAKRAGYPPDMTVLCFNCNCAKGIYGSCPHTWKDK